jgi:hypothetical protein
MAISKFKAPAEYAVYGGPADGSGPVMRVTGAQSLEQADEIIWDQKKKRPDWSFEVWQAGGWKRVAD